MPKTARLGRGGAKKALADVPLFAACTDKELRHIASLVDEVERPAGTVLTKEGEPGNEFFVIVTGQAEVRRNGRKVATVKNGAFIGEMSLIDYAPRTATVMAVTPITLLVVSSRAFSSLLDDHPTVARKLLRGLAGRIREHERTNLAL